MKYYVASNVFGSFAFDGKGRCLDSEFNGADPEKAVELYRNGTSEEKLLKRLKGYIVKDRKAEEFLRNGYRKLVEKKFKGGLNEFLVKTNVILSSEKIRSQGKDKIIMKVIGIIDELDEVLNNLTERSKEWYGLISSDVVVKENMKFLKVVNESKSKDINYIQRFTLNLEDMFATRDYLAGYLEDLCGNVMPNTSAVAGFMLASRLVEKAGGLDRLSKMPSSKIQLLGAEKALFRHLKGQGKAPKYGLIFGHSLVQNAPKEKKGKAARLVASKISIASKMDNYSGDDRSQGLLEDLEKKVIRL